MNLAKATFFLPLRDNDGRDLLAEHEVVRKAVYDLFDGWTFIGYFDGAYRMADGTQSLSSGAEGHSMATREQMEAEIRRLLAAETNAVRLSNALFTPGGLFSQLHSTTAEKKAVIDSPLFDEAQKRLSELQRQEAARLVRSSPPAVVPTAGPAQVERLTPSEPNS